MEDFSSESDNEFWDQLDKPDVFSYRPRSRSVSQLKISEVFPSADDAGPASARRFSKNDANFVSFRQRKESSVAVSSQRMDTVENESVASHEPSEAKSDLHDLLEQYERKIYELNEEIEHLRSRVMDRDEEICRLTDIVDQQDRAISEHTETESVVAASQTSEPDSTPNETGTQIPDPEPPSAPEATDGPGTLELSAKVKELEEQVETLTGTCSLYQKEVRQAQMNFDRVVKEKTELTDRYDAELAELRNQLKAAQVSQTASQVNMDQDIDTIKLEAKKELEAREEIMRRQDSLIKRLKNEIGTAKYLLTNPRIKGRLVQRLQDFASPSLELDRTEFRRIAAPPKQQPKKASLDLSSFHQRQGSSTDRIRPQLTRHRKHTSFHELQLTRRNPVKAINRSMDMTQPRLTEGGSQKFRTFRGKIRLKSVLKIM